MQELHEPYRSSGSAAVIGDTKTQSVYGVQVTKPPKPRLREPRGETSCGGQSTLYGRAMHGRDFAMLGLRLGSLASEVTQGSLKRLCRWQHGRCVDGQPSLARRLITGRMKATLVMLRCRLADLAFYGLPTTTILAYSRFKPGWSTLTFTNWLGRWALLRITDQPDLHVCGYPVSQVAYSPSSCRPTPRVN